MTVNGRTGVLIAIVLATLAVILAYFAIGELFPVATNGDKALGAGTVAAALAGLICLHIVP